MNYYVADVAQLKENIPFKAVVNNKAIVLYKTTKAIFALLDRCSHEEYPLSESTAFNDTIECKKHGSTFDLQTGKPLTLPALLPVETFMVSVDDGKIYIAI